jgi:tetratricopeptide (TPR) repeat protein
VSDWTLELLRELVALRRSRGSKTFAVETDDVTTTLVVKSGLVVSVSASKPGEPLGRLLVRKRLLTQEQYIEVLERMSAALGVGEKVRFGEVAVGLGYLTEDDVRQCLADQLRWLAARVFQSATPTWKSSEVQANRDTSRDVSLQIESLFLDAVRWVDDARRGALGLDEARSHALKAAWDIYDIDACFELTDDEASYARDALAGDKTVTELLEGQCPDSVDAHALLTALIATGAAETRARMKVGTRPSSVRPPAKRGPPSLPPWAKVDADNAKKALAKVERAAAAKVTAPKVTVKHAPAQQRLRGEQAFQRGKEKIRHGDYDAALVELEQALDFEPESTEYELLTRWCRHAARNEDLTIEHAAELERVAQEALRSDPKLAFGHFVLGEVLQAHGKRADARKQLMHAIRLEPDLFEAIRAQRVEAMRASRPSFDGKASPPRLPKAEPVAETTTSDAAPAEAKAAPAEAKAAARAEDATPRIEEHPARAQDAEGREDAPHAEGAAVVTATEADLVDSAPADVAAAAEADVAAAGPAAAVAAAAVAPETAAAPRSRGRAIAFALGGLLLIAGAGVAYVESTKVTTTTPAPPAPAHPSAVAQPTAGTVSAAATATAVPTTKASASDTTDASHAIAATDSATAGAGADADAPRGIDAAASAAVATAEAAPSPALDAKSGAILLPKSAKGHRLYLDGHVAGNDATRLVVPCGHHELRIGSHGAPHPVDVPCGGEANVR